MLLRSSFFKLTGFGCAFRDLCPVGLCFNSALGRSRCRTGVPPNCHTTSTSRPKIANASCHFKRKRQHCCRRSSCHVLRNRRSARFRSIGIVNTSRSHPTKESMAVCSRAVGVLRVRASSDWRDIGGVSLWCIDHRDRNPGHGRHRSRSRLTQVAVPVIRTGRSRCHPLRTLAHVCDYGPWALSHTRSANPSFKHARRVRRLTKTLQTRGGSFVQQSQIGFERGALNSAEATNNNVCMSTRTPGKPGVEVTHRLQIPI